MKQKMQLSRAGAPASSARQRGASLIEVLVAMLVTMVGLLGFAGLQSRALVAAEDSYVRTEAMALAQEFLERKRLNGSTEMFLGTVTTDPAIATYKTASNWTSALPISSLNCGLAASTCTPAQMAVWDIEQLRLILNSNAYIPQGQMMVTQSATTGMVNVYVSWGDEQVSDCVADGGVSGGLVRRNCVILEGI